MANLFCEDLAKKLTCSICLEVYTEPMELKCRHSFCKACVDQLKKSKRNERVVVCPTCRRQTQDKDIVKDFKMAEMVDTLQKHEQFPGDARCQLCEQASAERVCTQCKPNKVLCLSCNNAHRKYENCDPNASVALKEVVNKFDAKIGKQVEDVRRWQQYVDDEKNHQLGIVNEMEQSICDSIDEAHSEAKKKLEELFGDIKKKCFSITQKQKDDICVHYDDARNQSKRTLAYLQEVKKSDCAQKVQLQNTISEKELHEHPLQLPVVDQVKINYHWGHFKFDELFSTHVYDTTMSFQGQLKKLSPMKHGGCVVLCKSCLYFMLPSDTIGTFTYQRLNLETTNARSMTLTPDGYMLLATSDLGLIYLPLPPKCFEDPRCIVFRPGNYLDVTCVAGENGYKVYALNMDMSCNDDSTITNIAKRVFVERLVYIEGSRTPTSTISQEAVPLKEEGITSCAVIKNILHILDGNCVVTFDQHSTVQRHSFKQEDGTVALSTKLVFAVNTYTKHIAIVDKYARQIVPYAGVDKYKSVEVADKCCPSFQRFDGACKLVDNSWVIACQNSEDSFSVQIVKNGNVHK